MDRLITHLFVQSVHVSLELEGGSLDAGCGAGAVLLEDVGAMGVAGTIDWLEVEVKVLSTQSVLLVDVFKICCLDYDGIHNF